MKLTHPSTRAFIDEARRLKGFSLFDLLHGYFYARWTYFYIAIGTGRHRWAKKLAPLVSRVTAVISKNAGPQAGGFEDTYHAKVVTLSAARQLISIQEDIRLPDLEKVVPYTQARDIIIKNPDHIAVLDCPCRVSRENPCLPLDVCLIVGEPFASFVVEHNPQRARRITHAEADAILREEDRRGHVHHAFFKDAMLGRFYAICNCCACCCGAMQAQRGGTPMLASSGFVAEVDGQACQGCRKCEKACPFDAIHIAGERKSARPVIDPERCMGCGICAGQCKPGALHLARMESKGMPLEIEALLEDAIQAQNTRG
jgi:ferredoxin